MELSSTILDSIKEKSLELISFKVPDSDKTEVSQDTNVYHSNEVVTKGENIEYEPGKTLKLSEDSVMVLIDNYPNLGWCHPCQQVYFSAETGEVLKKIDSLYPTYDYLVGSTDYEPIHTPVEVTSTVYPEAQEVPMISAAVTSSSGNRYAILFSGITESHNLNDLEHMFRVLTEFYGYQRDNIYVLNHDGNADLTSWGKYVVNGSDYILEVKFPGTKEALFSVFETLNGKLEANDSVFLYFTGVGGINYGNGTENDIYHIYCHTAGSTITDSELKSKLESLPDFATLIIMMQQCFSGGFASALTGSTNCKASKIHFSASCEARGVASVSADFTPFSIEWTSAMRGEYPNGNMLELSTNNFMLEDARVSATEAFVYADEKAIPGVPVVNEGHLLTVNIPVTAEKPEDCGLVVFLGYPYHDLYMRDHIADDGEEGPSNKVSSRSPDVIVYDTEPSSEDIEYLKSPEGMGRNDLGTSVANQHLNYIYLRVQNRGDVENLSGNAKLYYAKPSALIDPMLWEPIDEGISVPSINPGEIGIVGPIAWYPQEATGHYCFIAIVWSGIDPEPNKNDIQSISQFHHFVAENNNVVWRNFNIVNMFDDGMVEIPLAISGSSFGPIQSDLKIISTDFDAKTEIELSLLKRLTENASPNNMTLSTETANNEIYKVKAGKVASLENLTLGRGDKSNARISLKLPGKVKDGYYELTIQQVVDEKITGEIVYMAAVGRHPFTANEETNEVHKSDCILVEKIKPEHKVAFKELYRAMLEGYNGCVHCLEEFDTDARTKQIKIVDTILTESLYDDPTKIPESELAKLKKIEEDIVDELKKSIQR